MRRVEATWLVGSTTRRDGTVSGPGFSSRELPVQLRGLSDGSWIDTGGLGGARGGCFRAELSARWDRMKEEDCEIVKRIPWKGKCRDFVTVVRVTRAWEGANAAAARRCKGMACAYITLEEKGPNLVRS